MTNRSYCFFYDFINIKTLDQNKIKTDEKSYKNILSYLLHWILDAQRP